MAKQDYTISVKTFGAETGAIAKRELRQQLAAEARSRGLKLYGSPNISIFKKMENWYNGEATQEAS